MTPSGPAIAPGGARRSVGLAANLTLRIASAATGTSPASALRARRGGGPAFGITVVACLSISLAACGFHPMYGSALAPQLSSIYVEPIAERDGYELRTSLIDALQSDGDAAGKAYRLKITLNETSQGIALQNDATITRYNDRLEAHYTLSDTRGNVLTTGTQTELSAYNVVQSPYATLTAEQDASKRAAQDVAERIHLDLGVWFRQQKKK